MDMSGEMLVGSAVKVPQMRYSVAYLTGREHSVKKFSAIRDVP